MVVSHDAVIVGSVLARIIDVYGFHTVVLGMTVVAICGSALTFVSFVFTSSE